MGIRPHAVWAVFRRNFAAYFGSPAGYVFIVIFVVASAFLAFNRETFFASNLADLSALNQVFLWLAVAFVPAIAMSVWSDERKLGTDELLFTLPVRDVEVVLGKYLATLGVYTVALLFALSNVAVLARVGRPDMGLLFANYLGYWFVGAAMIPLALVASSLTANMTVAFILGVLFCLCAAFFGAVLSLLPGELGRSLARGAGMGARFGNFTLGVVALPDVLYFALLAAAMLYVNMILIGKRHWSGGKHGQDMWRHYLLRGASVAVAAVAISVLAGRWFAFARWDTTAERLNSISPETVRLLRDLPGDRPVFIRAYVSPDVPESHVSSRETLIRVLNQIDAIGGGRTVVSIYDTAPYSDEARDAQERFNILPRPVTAFEEGRVRSQNVFLGVAFTCGPEEEVIEFMDRGLAVEYELARSVRTVAQAERPRVAVLQTDAQIFGGFDFQTMSSRPSWGIVEELRKQYRVEQAAPDMPISDDVDALIVALPSSLTQEQMDNLEDHILSGRPALLLLDPLPIVAPQLSPSQPKPPPQQDPRGGPPMPEEKGDIAALLDRIGLSWRNDEIVWDMYNPLTRLTELPPEIVFVSRDAGGARAFNEEEEIVKDLERVVMMFPGALSRVPGSPLEVIPLLATGGESGVLRWDQIIRPGMFGFGMTFTDQRQRPYVTTGREYLVAARVSGRFSERSAGKGGEDAQPRRANVIAVADLDFISEQFFELRRQGVRELDFDNITFLLNCVDRLAGDMSLVALRSRRPAYRTLTTIEEQRRRFRREMMREEERAEEEAERELARAQQRLDEQVEAVRGSQQYDDRTREIILRNLQQVENRRFENAKASIEEAKEERIERARLAMEQGIRRIENRVRLWAVLAPPLPAVAVGMVVFFVQKRREKRALKR